MGQGVSLGITAAAARARRRSSQLWADPGSWRPLISGKWGYGQLREENHTSTPFRFCFYDLRAKQPPAFFVSGGRQELNFERCDAFPYSAWKLLSDGTWPRLRVAKGVPEEHLQRLRKAPLDLEAGSGGWSVGIRALGPTASCAHFVFASG